MTRAKSAAEKEYEKDPSFTSCDATDAERFGCTFAETIMVPFGCTGAQSLGHTQVMDCIHNGETYGPCDGWLECVVAPVVIVGVMACLIAPGCAEAVAAGVLDDLAFGSASTRIGLGGL